jgi:hypothetical protein
MKLYKTIEHLDRVLVRAQTSRTQVGGFVPNGWVYGHKLILFATTANALLALTDSEIHYWWIIARGSTMRTDAVYTPSDCFETFAIPPDISPLEQIGELYDACRTNIMKERREGLTSTFNRYHSSDEISEDIAKLRRLHVELDQTVARTYGWTDLDLGHNFHVTKQGIRYTISETARREILDRLLSLNHERHAAEQVLVEAARPRRKKAKRTVAHPELF